MIRLSHYLIFSTVLFGIGIFGVLSRRNVIAVLMSVELMLNAVNINFVAINRFVTSGQAAGQLFSIFVIVVAAAEVSVGLALIISIYRHRKSVDLNNFGQIFVFWELVGVCSYFLIGFWFGKYSARDAAIKAFVTNRVGDFGFLLGILFLQIVFGTLNFQELSAVIPGYTNAAVLLPIAVLLFFGPVKKSAQFPLHVWLPDAMEGPTQVSALIHAATVVAAGVYLVVRAISGVPSMDLVHLASLDYPLTFEIMVFAFMAFGFGTLLSMFPFHAWSPDGYAGAPTAVSMIHAGVLKKIGGYGLIRIGLLVLPDGARIIAPVIAVLALGNVVYAAYICLSQKDLKYIVGYSSVSHMGYVLIGIAALNLISINGAIMMMFAHGVMAALFFAMIGNLYEKSHTRNVDDFGGLAHQMPRLAAGFMIAGLASLGLPGMVNFIGEFTIFVGAFSTYKVFTIIAVTGIVLTAVYICAPWDTCCSDLANRNGITCRT